jgi:hypothetical protein
MSQFVVVTGATISGENRPALGCIGSHGGVSLRKLQVWPSELARVTTNPGYTNPMKNQLLEDFGLKSPDGLVRVKLCIR